LLDGCGDEMTTVIGLEFEAKEEKLNKDRVREENVRKRQK
jgi:hypothetical protein